MTAMNLPFAASGPRRVPDASELSTGFPCGPADQELFNFLHWWTPGQIDEVIGGAGLTTDDADLTQLLQALRRFVLRRTRVTKTATGAYTCTNSTGGELTVMVRAWGAGGGGGYGAGVSGSLNGAAAGGGAGAYLEKVAVIPNGASITGSVGAGGAAGFAGTNGGTGGNTTVIIDGVTYTAEGGGGGGNANAGTASNSAPGGTVTGAVDLARDGFVSQGGLLIPSTGASVAGLGGASPLGGGGGNAGTGNGNNGQAPGGGGGGSANTGTAGVGARGEVWIEYAA